MKLIGVNSMPAQLSTNQHGLVAEKCQLGTCDKCEIGRPGGIKAGMICLPPDGVQGGLYVLGEVPGKHEASTQRAFTGDSSVWLRKLIAKHWSDPVSFDYAVRCLPPYGFKLKAHHVFGCMPYTKHNIEAAKPSRIVVFGSLSAFAVFGTSVTVYNNRRGWGMVEMPHGPVPVFVMDLPVRSLRNRFSRKQFEEDLEWALTWDGASVPTGLQAQLVESKADAELAYAELKKDRIVAVDIETSGHVFNSDFKILCVAVAALPGSRDMRTWVWHTSRCGEYTLQPLLDLLDDESITKVGQNFKFDLLRIRAYLGCRVKGNIVDIRLVRRLLEPLSPADLSSTAMMVGMGACKDAVGLLVNEAVKVIHGQVKAARKAGGPIPLHLEMASLSPKTYAFGMIDRETLLAYCGTDTQATVRVAAELMPQLQAKPSISRIWENLVQPASLAVTQVEEWGMLVDRAHLELARKQFNILAEEALLRVREVAGEDFWPTSTHQVGKLLHETLGLKCSVRTATGRPSTSMETLMTFAEKHPVVEDIVNYRRYTKLIGTYCDGVLACVRDDGRVHASLLLDGAASGRLSCNAPNMQNLPRPDTPEGKLIREAFIAPPGYTLLQADYAQIELRVAAMLSGDPVMTAAFQAGEDFHMQTAKMVSQQLWGIPPEEVTSVHRSQAKPIVFGTLYGMDVYGIANELGCSVKEAGAVVNAIMGRFKVLKRWLVKCLGDTKRTGVAYTQWPPGRAARCRPLFEVANSDGTHKSAERSSWNTPIQGTASDFTLASLTKVVEWIQDDLVPAKLIMTVHDSLLLEVRDDALDEAKYQLARIMESWPSNGVPLKADLEVGKTWGTLTKV